MIRRIGKYCYNCQKHYPEKFIRIVCVDGKCFPACRVCANSVTNGLDGLFRPELLKEQLTLTKKGRVI